MLCYVRLTFAFVSVVVLVSGSGSVFVLFGVVCCCGVGCCISCCVPSVALCLCCVVL